MDHQCKLLQTRKLHPAEDQRNKIQLFINITHCYYSTPKKFLEANYTQSIKVYFKHTLVIRNASHILSP